MTAIAAFPISVFGFNSDNEINGFDAPVDRVPTTQHYHFPRRLFASFVNWYMQPDGSIFLLTGPTGTGKTSFVEQFAARINVPVYSVKGNEDFRFQDIVGQFRFISDSPGMTPNMQYVAKAFLKAKRDGGILLINEYDYCNPGELAALNDVINDPIEINENGTEIVKSHPLFRVVFTGNSTGQGDLTGLYHGIQQQNIALLGRTVGGRASYLPAEEEKGIIRATTPGLPEQILDCMVDVANDVRKLFLGETGNGEKGTLPVTICTRILKAWALKTVQFASADKPVYEALEDALLFRCNSEEREAILKLAEARFGDLV
jgi:cobaltochelatase CobS